MNTYMNRWTLALGWAVGMLIVWSLFVPRSISVTTFFLLVAAELIVSVYGSTFFRDSQPPESVSAIIAGLEAPSGVDDPSRPTR